MKSLSRYAIRSQHFIEVCGHMNLFSEARIVAIESSQFTAVNNRDKNFTEHKLKAGKQQFKESIERYLSELDRGDRDPILVLERRASHLDEKFATVKAQMRKLGKIERQLRKAPDQRRIR